MSSWKPIRWFRSFPLFGPSKHTELPGPQDTPNVEQRPLRILITNVTLAGRTGTETVVRDLALGLLAAGQLPMVYSPQVGEIGAEIDQAGVPVVSDLRSLAAEPDIIHGHHHAETLQALLQFPKAPAIFVCHDRLSPNDIPPSFRRIARYVAVDLNCRERLVSEYGIPGCSANVIYNWVDINRFVERPPLPSSPQRALVFSHYAGENTHLEPIQRACAELGLPVDVAGSGSGKPCAAPERILGSYDLVFAKARCALEAMAVGTAVVLCDTRGLGSMVTASEVDRLRPWNFGMRLLQQPLESDLIVKEIRKYDPADAKAVSLFIRKEATLSSALEQYLSLYRQILTEQPPNQGYIGGEVRDYANAMILRINRLEWELAHWKEPYRMEPLTEGECGRLHLRRLRIPERVQPNQVFLAQVELENGTSVSLGSNPPYPLYFSYRWLIPGAGEPVVLEGPRTHMHSGLLPREKSAFKVRGWRQLPRRVSIAPYPGTGTCQVA